MSVFCMRILIWYGGFCIQNLELIQIAPSRKEPFSIFWAWNRDFGLALKSGEQGAVGTGKGSLVVTDNCFVIMF